MVLSKKQRIFTRNVADLIRYAYDDLGYELTFGDAYRDPEWQKVMVQRGLSRTMNSRHTMRLAVDFNLFRDGQYASHTEAYRKLGEYWESLDPLNRWGGFFDGFKDGNHFERRP